MTDAFILYTGSLCFGLILVAFVLTILEFRKMARRGPRKSAERGSTWTSGGEALASASPGGRAKR